MKIAVLLRSWAGEFLRGIDFFCEGSLASALAATPGLARPLPNACRIYLLAELAATVDGVPLVGILDKVVGFARAAGAVGDSAVSCDADQIARWRQVLHVITQSGDADARIRKLIP